MPKFDENPTYIEWVDSSSIDGWVEAHNVVPTRLMCRTIGWIVKENDTSVMIGGHITDYPVQLCGVLDIPKCAITKRIEAVFVPALPHIEGKEDKSDDPC